MPTKTLNLPDEFQVDGWGHKFAYAAWVPLTAKATSITSPAGFMVYGINPCCGGITVENAGHGYRTQEGAYALLSYGPDGHGSYLKSGTRYNAGVSNADEDTNAHYNSSGVNTTYAATYVQKDISLDASDASHPFQHIVRFKDRWQMQNDYDRYNPAGASCHPGFVINGYTAATDTTFGGVGEVRVGDVNGDGIPDLIIGDPGRSTDTGGFFVVFGTKNGFPDPLPLSSCNGVNCAEFDGTAAWNAPGNSVAIGDVNGDGIADILFSVTNQGYGYVGVVFGHTGAWNTTPQALNGAFLNGTKGFTINDSYVFSTNFQSVAAGNVNGDGVADIIIGDPKWGSNTADGGIYFANLPTNGQYIILGMPVSDYPSGVTWTFCTAGVSCSGTQSTDYLYNQTQIITNQGTTPLNIAATATQLVSDIENAATAGNDSLSGTYYQGGAYSTGGYIYARYNTPGTIGNSYILNPTHLTGASLIDDAVSNHLGRGVDGILQNGRVYVVFGQRCGGINSGFAACASSYTLSTSFINGANGVEYEGTVYRGMVGSSLTAGNVNGDGIADIAIGSGIYGGSCCINDQAFVIFGKRGNLLPVTTVITTSSSTCATVGSANGLIVGQTIYSSTLTAGTTITAIGTDSWRSRTSPFQPALPAPTAPARFRCGLRTRRWPPVLDTSSTARPALNSTPWAPATARLPWPPATLTATASPILSSGQDPPVITG